LFSPLWLTAVVALVGMASWAEIVNQFDQNVPFRLGWVRATRQRGLRVIIPFVNNLSRVAADRDYADPVHGSITCDTVGVEVSVVAHFRVVDAMGAVDITERRRCYRTERSDRAFESGWSNRSRQTLSETAGMDLDVSEILGRNRAKWGIEVNLVEL
jgi:regulator of protease activity HflC (stomatin/prohibitin superfamily)